LLLNIDLISDVRFASSNESQQRSTNMLHEIFVYCTLIGGGALLIQVGMMFLGLDDIFESAEGDMDMGFDMEGEGGDSGGFWLIEMLSIKTLTAALTFFGLGGWICIAAEQSNGVALTVALIAGYAAMYSVYWALKQMLKLEQSGNMDVRNAVGKPAKVYIPIPAKRSGNGKVQMKVQNRTAEYLAVTDDMEALKTGEDVVVVDLIANDTVMVERAPEPIEA